MRQLIVLAVAAAALSLAACNTVFGVGKDVSAAGHAVTKTADDAKH
jgi:predicted small secreted protein